MSTVFLFLLYKWKHKVKTNVKANYLLLISIVGQIAYLAVIEQSMLKIWTHLRPMIQGLLELSRAPLPQNSLLDLKETD